MATVPDYLDEDAERLAHVFLSKLEEAKGLNALFAQETKTDAYRQYFAKRLPQHAKRFEQSTEAEMQAFLFEQAIAVAVAHTISVALKANRAE